MEKSLTLSEMKKLACDLARNLKKGTLIKLIGEMGAGKTTFCSFIVDYFNENISTSSPTFTVVNHYKLKAFDIYHLDLYKLKNTSELLDIGIEEMLDEIIIVEWPNMLEKIDISADYIIEIEIKFDNHNLDKRFIKMQNSSLP